MQYVPLLMTELVLSEHSILVRKKKSRSLSRITECFGRSIMCEWWRCNWNSEGHNHLKLPQMSDMRSRIESYSMQVVSHHLGLKTLAAPHLIWKYPTMKLDWILACWWRCYDRACGSHMTHQTQKDWQKLKLCDSGWVTNTTLVPGFQGFYKLLFNVVSLIWRGFTTNVALYSHHVTIVVLH